MLVLYMDFSKHFLADVFCTMSLAVLTISQYSVSIRNYVTLLTTRGNCWCIWNQKMEIQKRWGNKWVPSLSGGCSFKFHKNEGTYKNIWWTKPNRFGGRSQNYQRNLRFLQVDQEKRIRFKAQMQQWQPPPKKSWHPDVFKSTAMAGAGWNRTW